MKKNTLSIKEITLQINEKEFKIIKDCMDFYFENWETEDKDGVYKVLNGPSFKTEEEFLDYFYSMPPLKKKYKISDNIVFELNVDNCTEMGLHGYINNSLYTIDDELLIHNVCKYDKNDIFKGFGFSIEEDFHNNNEIFEITDLGKKLLSDINYVIKFEII